MSWKKMVFGEKMPDKDDPKYKERYKKEVAAGRQGCPAIETRQGGRGRTTLCLQTSPVVSCHCVRHCADLLGA